MSARSGGFIAIQGTANAKTWPVEDMIRARSKERRVENVIRMHGTGHGEAPARGQFALFGKGRALERWYQTHGVGSKGQGADGDSAALSVMGSQLLRGAGEPPPPKATDAPGTPASAGTQLSSIGRIPTGRGIEWLEILRLRSRLRRSYAAASRMTRKENRAV
jgi:hypothetical protein